MRRRPIFIGLFVALIALCAAIPLLGALQVHATGTLVGTLQATQVSTNPPTYDAVVTGRSQIAGLAAGDAVLNYKGITLSPNGDYLVGTPAGGTGTVTLANGDKIFGTFQFLSAATENAEVLSIVGTIRVTGGTGAFTNLSGTAIARGSGNVRTNEVNLTFEGFIASPTLPSPRRGPRI